MTSKKLNVIRYAVEAYAFHDGNPRAVSELLQGDIPSVLMGN